MNILFVYGIIIVYLDFFVVQVCRIIKVKFDFKFIIKLFVKGYNQRNIFKVYLDNNWGFCLFVGYLKWYL